MLVGGPPCQGKSASFIWSPHACQPVWMPFFVWKFPPGMEEDFERCSVTLITFRTATTCCWVVHTRPGGGRLCWGHHAGVFCQAGGLHRSSGSLRGLLSVGLGSGKAPTLAPSVGHRGAVGSPATEAVQGAQTASPGHQKDGPWTSSGGRASSLQSRTPRAFLARLARPLEAPGLLFPRAPWPEGLTHLHTLWRGPQALMLFSNPSLHLGRRPQTSTPTGEPLPPRCPNGLPASSTLKTSPSALCSSGPEGAPPEPIPLPGPPPQLLGPPAGDFACLMAAGSTSGLPPPLHGARATRPPLYIHRPCSLKHSLTAGPKSSHMWAGSSPCLTGQ